MATFLSDQYNLPVPGTGDGGSLKVLAGERTFATAATIGQTLAMFTIPKGFVPMFGWLMGDDIDTGIEALELDVGIVGDASKFLDSGVITGDTVAGGKITVGIMLQLQEELLTEPWVPYAADTDLIVTFTAAPVGGGTGTIKVILCGVYNDPRF